jgi:hypothetical protein
MKAHLLNNLSRLSAEVAEAAANVYNIYTSSERYKSTKMVYWTEKKSYLGGVLKQVTHYKTIHHAREEIIFDNIRFDQDLSSANAILQQKQQQLNKAKLEVQEEISNTRSAINEYNIGISNARSIISKYATLNKELQEEYIRKELLTADMHKKIASLNGTEKAKLVYKAVIDNQQELLNIVKAYGYWPEFTAYIAVAQDNMKVFDYCLAEKVDLDSFIEEDTTIAKYIIASGKKEFISKLFLSNQELIVTAYTALMQKDFTMLELLASADSKIIQKIKLVDSCGLTAIQLAIAKEDIELIQFLKKHDEKCLEERFIGYKDAMDMALFKENTNIIKEIASSMPNIPEYVINAHKQGTLHHFSLLIRHIESKDLSMLFTRLIAEGFSQLAKELVELKGATLIATTAEEGFELSDIVNLLMMHANTDHIRVQEIDNSNDNFDL